MNASPGFRRILAVALLILLILVIWRMGIQPVWQAWQQDRETVADYRDAIARFKGLAAAGTRYEAALSQLRQQAGFTDALIRSPSATLAAADLQQRVKRLVEQSGGSLVSAQPSEAEPAGPFIRIGLGVRMIVSVEALQKVLHALETRTPVVVIDEMLVLSRGGRNARRRAQVRDQLDVRLELSAFTISSAPESTG